jgi:hypothetical protein
MTDDKSDHPRGDPVSIPSVTAATTTATQGGFFHTPYAIRLPKPAEPRQIIQYEVWMFFRLRKVPRERPLFLIGGTRRGRRRVRGRLRQRWHR